jgi:hypothetical protein
VLADDLFRIAHDDSTGKPRLHPDAVRLGLAAALLTELLLERKVSCEAGKLYVTNTAPPRDALTHVVLDDLLAEPARRDINTWLVFFADTAYERVAQRLLRGGHVEVCEPRGWRRRPPVYLPADRNDFATPGAVLAEMLRRGTTTLSVEQRCLAALAQATGLGRHTFDGQPAYASEHVAYLEQRWWADLCEVLHATRTAIARAVLSHRV